MKKKMMEMDYNTMNNNKNPGIHDFRESENRNQRAKSSSLLTKQNKTPGG